MQDWIDDPSIVTEPVEIGNADILCLSQIVAQAIINQSISTAI